MRRQRATPMCPHCRELAPNGDERIVWLRVHLESRTHRWWWKFKTAWKRNM